MPTWAVWLALYSIPGSCSIHCTLYIHANSAPDCFLKPLSYFPQRKYLITDDGIACFSASFKHVHQGYRLCWVWLPWLQQILYLETFPFEHLVCCFTHSYGILLYIHYSVGLQEQLFWYSEMRKHKHRITYHEYKEWSVAWRRCRPSTMKSWRNLVCSSVWQPKKIGHEPVPSNSLGTWVLLTAICNTL